MNKQIYTKVLYKKASTLSSFVARYSFFTLTICIFAFSFLLLNSCKDSKKAKDSHKITDVSISDKTKEYLQKNEKKIHINIIELRSAYPEMRESVEKLLQEFQLHSNNRISITHKNDDNPIFDKIATGAIVRAQIIYKTDTVTIGLTKQIEGLSVLQSLEASISDLEYKFTTAIQSLLDIKERHIAFIEGHNELSRVYTYEAEEALSRYYNISRGQIGNNIADLDNFDAIIIAGPKQQFSTSEKYIIDQYIMHGGRVLWLIDGAYFSINELTHNGYSASIKNETNLDDMLFTYGVRINPDFVQDKQCVKLRTEDSNYSEFDFYTPLLNSSDNSPISRNIGWVKTSFISSIDTVKTRYQSEKTILLYSSNKSRISKVPDPVSYDNAIIGGYISDFNRKNIPTAISLQGVFESVFANRVIPQEVVGGSSTLTQSKETRMIVVSSSDIIRNEVKGYGNETQVIPMGYDALKSKQYGNREFIINAVNWLTDDDNWMQLRMK